MGGAPITALTRRLMLRSTSVACSRRGPSGTQHVRMLQVEVDRPGSHPGVPALYRAFDLSDPMLGPRRQRQIRTCFLP